MNIEVKNYLLIFGLALSNSLLATTIDKSIEQKAIDTLQNDKNIQRRIHTKENYDKESEHRWRNIEQQDPHIYIKKNNKENYQDNNTKPTENCIKIYKVNFIGIENFPLLTRIALRNNVKNLLLQCPTIESLSSAVSSSNQLLFEKGFVTSRVHMVEQDISNGIFEINITAGIIKNYKTNGLSPWQVTLLMPSGLLNYNYLNNGLDNLKKLRSNVVNLKIEPGEKIGESNIQVKNTTTKIWHGDFTIKNDHSSSNNYMSSNVNIEIDNIFRSNDLWSFSVNESLKERSLQKNQLLNAKLFIPIRRSTFQFNTSKSSFYNHIDGNNIVFKASGITHQRALNINYLLFKDTKSSLHLDWGIERKKDSNLISDATIDIQSGTTRTHASTFDYKIKINDNFRAQIKSTHYEGSFTGYDVGIDVENTEKFQRYLHQGVLAHQKHNWQLQLESYLQESHSILINDQRFSLYTTFIPGIIYIPAQEGKLHTLKSSYYFNRKNISYTPEIQISHSELKNDYYILEVSGLRLRNIIQSKNFTSILEIGKAIKSPQKDKDIAGSISLNLSF